MRSRQRRTDKGFTLIEAVISIMIISIAVVALVGGLVTLIQLTQSHRGHAIVETATKSFGQAVQAAAQSPARLAASINDSTTTITVVDATTLPVPGANSYLLLDREIVKLNTVDRLTGDLSVTRGQGGTTRSAHTTASSVVPHLRCPTATELTPWASAYQVAAGVTPTITDVEYVEPTTGDFTSTNSPSCISNYEVLCPAGALLAECGARFFRVSISISTAGDSRLRDVSGSTQVLVRAGSP